MSENDFNAFLQSAFDETMGSSAYRNDRDRPYDGQRHTDSGERGKTLVEGLTMRDVKDCFIKAFLICAGDEIMWDKVKNKAWLPSDVYLCEEDFDPIAIAQTLTCEIEKMMGIFPNVPPTIEVNDD